jgi:hypothetical protein
MIAGIGAISCKTVPFQTCSAELTGWCPEVKSGRKADRPELREAVDLARLTGATVVIAKLDRQSHPVPRL